jgi:hypothetical protein
MEAAIASKEQKRADRTPSADGLFCITMHGSYRGALRQGSMILARLDTVSKQLRSRYFFSINERRA